MFKARDTIWMVKCRHHVRELAEHTGQSFFFPIGSSWFKWKEKNQFGEGSRNLRHTRMASCHDSRKGITITINFRILTTRWTTVPIASAKSRNRCLEPVAHVRLLQADGPPLIAGSAHMKDLLTPFVPMPSKKQPLPSLRGFPLPPAKKKERKKERIQKNKHGTTREPGNQKPAKSKINTKKEQGTREPAKAKQNTQKRNQGTSERIKKQKKRPPAPKTAEKRLPVSPSASGGPAGPPSASASARRPARRAPRGHLKVRSDASKSGEGAAHPFFF